MSDDDTQNIPCRVCGRAGLIAVGQLCPACDGAGYVPTTVRDRLVRAIMTATASSGAPTTVSLADLHDRWKAPNPETIALLFSSDQHLKEHLQTAGVSCLLIESDEVIAIELLAVVEPDT